MVSLRIAVDEKAAAQLLWQMKTIATKEVENLPFSCKHSVFLLDTPSVTSQDSEEESTSDVRGRSVSVESMEMVQSSEMSPVRSSTSISFIKAGLLSPSSTNDMEHYDWSNRATPYDAGGSAPKLSSPQVIITQKYGKRKRESFVGLTTTKSGPIRATLRKKFSWKQYPEVGYPTGTRVHFQLARSRC
jgi:hypothetical protein